MRKDIVIKKIKSAVDSRKHVEVSKLDKEVVAQIANAYVSGARGLLPLYSKKAIAEYYETTEGVVSECIDRAIRCGYIKFSTVMSIIRNSADNERRHAKFSSLTKSEKRYAEIMSHRISNFKISFDDEGNRQKYDAAYKAYLGHKTLKNIMSSFGFCMEEMIFLLKFKACIDMTQNEYDIFCQKFYYDFLGTEYYNWLYNLVKEYRRDHKEELSKQGTPEWEEVRSKMAAKMLNRG